MKEASVEDYHVEQGAARGVAVKKLIDAGGVGWPDRTCVGFDGAIAFTEMKRPKGSRDEKRQRYTQRKLRERGFWVAKLYSKAEVDAFWREWDRRHGS